ncbi:PIG-L family deacetylase [Streptomyces capparidis]
MSPATRVPAQPSRRGVLTAAVLCALVPLEAATGWGRDSPARRPHLPPDRATAAPTGSWAAAGRAVRTEESVLQVVAHPDDDLFFINPEVGQSLRSGRPLTTVYLTSGEANGRNAPKGARRLLFFRPPRDKAKYAKARQNGIRAAYAEMVTGDPATPWRRLVIATAGGGLAELDTLEGHPHIRLVWTLLRESGSVKKDRPESLCGLWHGRTPALTSQLAHGGTATRDFAYTREQLIDTLVGHLEHFRPTQVRIQDPTPGRHGRDGGYADHQDHFHGARFVQEALARYAATGRGPHFTVQGYLGYGTSALPPSLDPASGASKARSVETYGWVDADACRDPAGCGDRKVAANPRPNWAHSIHHTGDAGTSWLRTGGDGGLWAFAVLSGRIAHWHRPGGGADARWRGPLLLPETGVDAGIRPVALPDGRLAVFGTRTLFGDRPGGYLREAGCTVQDSAGAFGPWRSLGTPEADDASGTSDISAPAVSVHADGTMTVFLRDSRRRLVARRLRADGRWTPWRSAGGRNLHGDPVACTDERGRGYVLAATPHTVLAWVQDRDGGPVRGPLPTGLPPTTPALSACPDGDGVRVYFRRPRSGNVLTARLTAEDLAPPGRRGAGPARVRVADLGGVAGHGPVSATAAAGGRVLLAARSSTGDVGTAWAGAGRGRPRWSRTGFLASGAPSGTALPSGGTALAVLGLDGRLYWTRTTGRGAAPVPWEPAVAPPSRGGARERAAATAGERAAAR